MKEIIKKFEKIVKTDKAGAVKMLPSAFQTIDKAAQKGVIKKNNAAQKSPAGKRLKLKINELLSTFHSLYQ